MQCWICLFQRFVEAAKAQENERLVLMRDTVQQLPPPNYRYCTSRARTVISPQKKQYDALLGRTQKIYSKKKLEMCTLQFPGICQGKKSEKREKTTRSFSAYVLADCVSFCCFALVSHVIALLLFLLPPLLRFYLPIFCAEFRKKGCAHTQTLTVPRSATKNIPTEKTRN